MGDFEDLKTMLVEAKKKTGSDFMLINPMHAAEPVPPLTPSPYLPISRRFINFSYIRPESMPEYLTLSHEDRAEVDALHEQVESLNDNARLESIATPCGASRSMRCGSSTRPAEPRLARPNSTVTSPNAETRY